MTDIAQLLGKDADNLLQHRCMTIPSDQLYLPGHDYVDRVMIDNNRPPAVLRNMQTLYNTGRLAGTGYLSILPVDQGVEHSAGASFAANPLYFDPKNIVELAIEAGCNCVASTYGVLASVSRRYAHRIPFLVKLNHNETLSLPEHLRSNAVCQRGAGVQHGCGGGWCDYLFWLGRVTSPD